MDENTDPLLDATKAQNAADTQVLISEIGPARLELARLKVAHYAMKAGLDLTFEVKGLNGTPQAKEFALQKLIDKASVRVNILQAMYEDIAGGTVIPQPEHPLSIAK